MNGCGDLLLLLARCYLCDTQEEKFSEQKSRNIQHCPHIRANEFSVKNDTGITGPGPQSQQSVLGLLLEPVPMLGALGFQSSASNS